MPPAGRYSTGRCGEPAVKQPRNRPPSASTPARIALVRELWPTLTPTTEIIAQMAALPGLQPVRASHVRRWAQIAHVTRPAEICNAERAATRRANRVVKPAAPARHWRHEALTRIANGGWTVEKLTVLCDLWDAGHTVTTIAARLDVTPNAASGRIHRLQARALLEPRASPIIRDGAPTPKKAATPAPLPAPTVTLPPLPSVAVERVYKGPATFSFASHRPPLPVVPIRREYVADDGSWPTGPAKHPCQFVVQDGSVTETWIHCGLPVARGAWCKIHLSTVYHSYVRPRQGATL